MCVVTPYPPPAGDRRSRPAPAREETHMLELLPDPARIALIVSSVAYGGFWLLVLAFALTSSLWRRLRAWRALSRR